MYRLLRFFYKNPSALTSLLLLPPQSRRLCEDPQYTLHVACGIHFCKSCRRAHSAASPLSQKVTLGVPVRLQAPSRRLAVATNFLRVTGVQLQPLKSQKNLFHVNETRRSKLCIACSDFFTKIRARSRRCSSFPRKAGGFARTPNIRCMSLAAYIFAKAAGALIPLRLLFRKKSRSARLFGCKGPHNGLLSLTTLGRFVSPHNIAQKKTRSASGKPAERQ